MERNLTSHARSYAELEELSRTRRLQEEQEDRNFAAECAREIEHLKAANSAKLDALEEETRAAYAAANKAAQKAMSELKAEHEKQLRIVMLRHAEEVEKLENDNASKVKLYDSRDQRSSLEAALAEVVERKRMEHEKLKEDRLSKRTLDNEREKAILYDFFQRIVAGQASVSGTSKLDAEAIEEDSGQVSGRSSPEYVPAYSSATYTIEDDTEEDTVVSPTQLQNNDDGNDSDDSMSDQIEGGGEEEHHEHPDNRGSKGGWGPGARYLQAKDKLPVPLGNPPPNPEPPLQHPPNLSHLHPGHRGLPRRPARGRPWLGNHRGYVSGHTQSSPFQHQANSSSPFSKAPAHAPTAPREIYEAYSHTPQRFSNSTPRHFEGRGVRHDTRKPYFNNSEPRRIQSDGHRTSNRFENKRDREEDRTAPKSVESPCPNNEMQATIKKQKLLKKQQSGEVEQEVLKGLSASHKKGRSRLRKQNMRQKHAQEGQEEHNQTSIVSSAISHPQSPVLSAPKKDHKTLICAADYYSTPDSPNAEIRGSPQQPNVSRSEREVFLPNRKRSHHNLASSSSRRYNTQEVTTRSLNGRKMSPVKPNYD